MKTDCKELLEILGFPKNKLQKIPKIKEIRKQFLKLAKVRHSDKPTGSDKDMKKLLYAYNKVGKMVEAMENEDPDDQDEETARDQFKQFNFSNLNKNSISMFIYTMHVEGCEKTLTEQYGVPKR